MDDIPFISSETLYILFIIRATLFHLAWMIIYTSWQSFCHKCLFASSRCSSSHFAGKIFIVQQTLRRWSDTTSWGPCTNDVSLIFGIFAPPSPCQNLYYRDHSPPLSTDVICTWPLTISYFYRESQKKPSQIGLVCLHFFALTQPTSGRVESATTKSSQNLGRFL